MVDKPWVSQIGSASCFCTVCGHYFSQLSLRAMEITGQVGGMGERSASPFPHSMPSNGLSSHTLPLFASFQHTCQSLGDSAVGTKYQNLNLVSGLAFGLLPKLRGLQSS